MSQSLSSHADVGKASVYCNVLSNAGHRQNMLVEKLISPPVQDEAISYRTYIKKTTVTEVFPCFFLRCKTNARV